DEVRRRLARTYIAVSSVLRVMDQPGEAQRAADQAHVIVQQLVEDNPANTQLRGDLAQSLGFEKMHMTGRQTETLAAEDRVPAIRKKLAKDNPAAIQLQADLALSHQIMGFNLWLSDRPTEALAAFERGLAICEKLAAENPKVPGFRRAVGQSLSNIGRMKL